MEKLFGTFERQRSSPSKRREASYQFLNQSNWSWVKYYRSVIEEWYQYFPRDRNFYTQFTSNLDEQHNSAYFELFMFSLLRKAGYDVTYHQQIENRKIDLSFVFNQSPIYIDCILSGVPNTDPIIEKIEEEIEDLIEDIKNPILWISVRFQSTNRKKPNLKLLKKFLTESIDEMQLSPENDTEFTWYNGGWIIEIEMNRKTIDSETTIASVSTSQGGGWLDEPSMKTLRRTLNYKRGRSYKVEGPFVIAVNTHNMMLSTDDIFGTLFGTIDTINYKNNLSVEYPYFFFNIPQNTSVSGILIVKGLYSSNMGSVAMELWENPWAKYPLKDDVLNVTRITPVIDFSNRIIEIKVKNGQQPYEILGIEQNYHNYDL